MTAAEDMLIGVLRDIRKELSGIRKELTELRKTPREEKVDSAKEPTEEDLERLRLIVSLFEEACNWESR